MSKKLVKCETCSKEKLCDYGSRFCSVSCSKIAERNINWKGNSVGYGGLHSWIKNRFPKQPFCEVCKINKPYDLANISQMYKREITDWEWLCRRCHMIKDGRLDKFRTMKRVGNYKCNVLMRRTALGRFCGKVLNRK